MRWWTGGEEGDLSISGGTYVLRCPLFTPSCCVTPAGTSTCRGTENKQWNMNQYNTPKGVAVYTEDVMTDARTKRWGRKHIQHTQTTQTQRTQHSQRNISAASALRVDGDSAEPAGGFRPTLCAASVSTLAHISPHTLRAITCCFPPLHTTG